MANNDRFRANMAKRIEKAKGKTELFYKKLTLELYSRIVLKSAVDTGRFRANWDVSYGVMSTKTSDATDKEGLQTIAKASTEIGGFKIDGRTIWITNSLPYAYRLEYEGWSRQSPAGMVRVTLAELSGVARLIANEVKRS